VGKKLDAYIALANLFGVSKKTNVALHEFAKDATGLSEQRNRAVHDPWLLISPKTKAHRFEVTARRKLRAELVPMPTGDVESLAENIDKLTARFETLARQILAETHSPSPEVDDSTPTQ